MNIKLILQLSLFGLAMALLTISIIPTSVEPACWLIIFLINAIIIARNCNNRYFLNGFLVSIANSIWITAAHVIWYNTYMAHHPQMQLPANFPLATHPRIMMIITGPIVGAMCGLIQGLLALIAAKTPLKKKAVDIKAA